MYNKINNNIDNIDNNDNTKMCNIIKKAHKVSF